MNTQTEPMVLLVDGAAGVYAYQSLIERYPLFLEVDGDYLPIAEALAKLDMEGETPETVFDPQNPHVWENVDWMDQCAPIHVRADNGEFWRVESIDGDLWAINPRAEWEEDEDTYTLRDSSAA